MKNNKYKILVLSNLKESTNTVLKSAINLANKIDGEIELFHVKSAVDVVKRESQLSANRNINKQFIVTKKKIEEIIKPLSEDCKFKLKHKYAVGNIKDEIENHISKTKPDIIVLGKRKSKTLNIIGDNVTNFVLKKHSGTVMIASDEDVLNLNNDLSLGVLNGINKSLETTLTKNLISNTNASIKLFRIRSSSNEQKLNEDSKNPKTIEYVFEDNSNIIDTISSYIDKSKIDLFCLDRNNDDSKKLNYVKDVIDKINVSFLVN